MNSLLQSSFLSLVLLSACVGQPTKPEPPKKDPRKELINTICGKCPCQHVQTEGEDVSADCYPPSEEGESHGRRI